MREISFNKKKDQKRSILCLMCKRMTKHTVLTSVDVDGRESMGGDDWFFYQVSYEITQCDGCEEITFRTESSNSEDFDEDGNSSVTVLVYPKRSKDTRAVKDFFNAPYNLRTIYRETVDCYNNQNLTLCGAGVRALVEGICLENQITDGEVEISLPDGKIKKKRVNNLQGRINGLAEKGKLTRENAEILHEHRFLGNEAVHTLIAPTSEELTLALEIVEHVLDSLYEIPEKALELRRERQRSAQKKKKKK